MDGFNIENYYVQVDISESQGASGSFTSEIEEVDSFFSADGEDEEDEALIAQLHADLAKIQEKIRTSHTVERRHLLYRSSVIKSSIALKTEKYSPYLRLYRATLDGDWETTREVIEHDNEAVTAEINHFYETALHIAVEAGKSHLDFVNKLVQVMEHKDLEVKDNQGNSALCMAAIVGNTGAARILVGKNPGLVYILNHYKNLPVHEAACHAHKETLAYLRQVTDANTYPYPYSGEVGFTHLLDLISAEFYDVAADLVTKYPQLATTEIKGLVPPLVIMSNQASAFPSGTRLGLLERHVYSVLQVKFDKTNAHNNGDIDRNTSSHPRPNRMQVYASIRFKAIFQRFLFVLSEGLGFIAPHTKAKKLANYEARQLVKSLCKVISLSNHNGTYIRYTRQAIILAAKNGIPEVIEEIIHALPVTIWSAQEGLGIFQWAVVNRCEKVFNIVYQIGDQKQRLLQRSDNLGNNILHLAGQIAPLHKLNLVSGAALQMQREIQWYKEVEKFVTKAGRQRLNNLKNTPQMVFSEAHEKLVVAGEKWMKDTATSCMIAATLIVTIVFAAAITVPGGLDQNTGKPMFSKQSAFKLFFLSNAVSLFTSTTSLLMFLSILTARYAEQDFLFSLPNKLIIGLVTLILSTTSMMIAFCSILYLVYGEGNAWSILPIIGFASLPVTSFVALQFPLLVDVISSTYGRGIFGKQSSRRLY